MYSFRWWVTYYFTVFKYVWNTLLKHESESEGYFSIWGGVIIFEVGGCWERRQILRLKKLGIQHEPPENEAYRVSSLKRLVVLELHTASYSFCIYATIYLIHTSMSCSSLFLWCWAQGLITNQCKKEERKIEKYAMKK